MRMVEESKNEWLTMLLGKTNDLLVRLGAAVRRQKDAKHDGIEPLNGPQANVHQTPTTKMKILEESVPDEDDDLIEAKLDDGVKPSALLEGQRQYNLVIHSIQEKVTEQPSILQGGELRQYQLEGLQWMPSLFNNNLNRILADEMGLGKTIQTISLIAYLMENKGVTKPHLIVAPKAVLPNRINEFSTWAPWRKQSEWDNLVSWIVNNELYSDNVVWLIQLPRLYNIYKEMGIVTSFQTILDNVFLPLFEVTVDPSSHPQLHIFLKQFVGLDLVDDESKPERRPTKHMPTSSQWTNIFNPAFSYYVYYCYVNLYTLIKGRIE